MFNIIICDASGNDLIVGIAFYCKLYGNTCFFTAKSSNITYNVTKHRLMCHAWYNQGNGQNLAVSIGSFLSRLWAEKKTV